MASLLETFGILITADATGVKKGVKDAKKEVNDLEYGLISADTISNKLGDSLGKLAKRYGGLITALFSAGALVASIKYSLEYADTLNKASEALNVNIETLDAWGGAVRTVGGTAESFQQTLKSAITNDTFQAVARSLTGVRGRVTDVISVLPRMAELFERLGRVKSGLLGQKLGLDQGTILLLQQGRREVDSVIARQKELGVVTKQDAEIASAFNLQWMETGQTLRRLTLTATGEMIPGLTKLGKIIERIALDLNKHKPLITGAIIGIAGAITYFLLPALAKLAIITLPFTAIAAGIGLVVAAFALLYDDFKNFDEGNRSVLGEAVKRWETFGKVVHGADKAMGFFNRMLSIAGDNFLHISDNFIDGFKSLYTLIKSIIELLSIELPYAWAKIKEFFTGDATLNLQAAQQAHAIANSSPLAAQSATSILNSNSAANKSTVINTGPITISTPTSDPQTFGAEFVKSLTSQLRQATNSFDDGVVA